MKFMFFLGLLAFGHVSANQVPVFQFETLLYNMEHDRSEFVQEAVKNVGAFIISGLPNSEEYTLALEHLQTDARNCLDTSKNVVKANYGTVERITSALFSEDETTAHPECLNTQAIESGFNEVGILVKNLIGMINEELPFYYEDRDTRTLARTYLSNAPYLDHVHLYKQIEDPSQEFGTLPLHQDNGLFLLVTPSKIQPLMIKDNQGNMLTANEGDVIVVFGRAMDEWLFQNELTQRFQAAPHGVPAMVKGEDRVVYARMYVAPTKAVPDFAPNTKTFGAIFYDNGPAAQHVSDLCSSGGEFIQATRDMCPEGTEYCWMACLPISEGCPLENQQCNNSGGESCCLEGQTTADGCLDMDTSCTWACATKDV
ncbi:hypothetical protein TCAL_08509 [Tigriopus californicus]|uniref:Fe2OG dioxygenase domain-containing protein n=1 Tax=Tigriopus californicus TaxID=6832 RepID=A0A553PJA6_TIGCA|nr:uncharacterized protein LOC131890199 [Tigriopus californicus]TRY77766.1 hypothetical protein TCAL_08509 [Tigriopus californicus]|eukprot:TCALIF_08509-PA protein Name:"Protein of unknown function" AED:0.00 eAED:0.00 QI:172/1/1/1/1/1/2/47/369